MDIDKQEREAAKHAQQIREALANMETAIHKEAVMYLARITREKFLSLVQAGFTEAQALELLKVKT